MPASSKIVLTFHRPNVKLKPLKVKKRHTFRFYPTDEQKVSLAQTFGCVRVVYNKALEYRKSEYEEGRKVGTNQASKMLTALKQEDDYVWLKDPSAVPLQQCLRHLQTAYKNFFEKRSRYPTFKKKSHEQKAEYTKAAFTWDSKHKNLSMAKIGKLRVIWSRKIESEPSTVTIIKTPTGKYFVSMCVEETCYPLPKTGDKVGVDLGLGSIIALSTGETVPHEKVLRQQEKRLAKAQRVLSRRKKGSGRWHRQRVKVARIHEKTRNKRKDILDKLTTDLVRRFDLICIEDLNASGLLKNRRLAKSIGDASWRMLREMLEYKCEWYGKRLIVIDRWFPSSKLCSCCGYKSPKMTLNIRDWTCPECGGEHDRDINAAINILAEGCSVIAREDYAQSDSSGSSCRNVKHLSLPCVT